MSPLVYVNGRIASGSGGVRHGVVSSFVFIPLSTLGLIILLACGPAAQTVLSTNFEDGMTDRWIPRGTGTTLTNSALQANTGTHRG